MERAIGIFVSPSRLLLALLILVASLDATADPGTGRLFGTNASPGDLLDINPVTGAASVIGATGAFSTPALATDPTTGVVYMGTGAGDPRLFTVNPVDGSSTFVGDTGLGAAAVGGMDFDSDGTLFAAVNLVGLGGTGSDHLAILDKNTGLATVLGPFGTCGATRCSIEGIEGIAFDGQGRLFGVHTARGAAGPPGLYQINPIDGQASFVTAIVDTAGAPPSGGLSSIQFACDGTLFGGTAKDNGAPDGGFLVTLNSVTGIFSFVGPAAAAPQQSLGALAFEGSACPARRIPTLPTWGLIGFALLLLASLYAFPKRSAATA
jgi:hypothetical protein